MTPTPPAEDDRDRRQLSHFVDLEALDRNREQEARRRQQAGRQQQQQQLGAFKDGYGVGGHRVGF